MLAGALATSRYIITTQTDIDPEWVMSEEVNRCAKKACCPWLGMDYS
jgi:hypothetical protein